MACKLLLTVALAASFATAQTVSATASPAAGVASGQMAATGVPSGANVASLVDALLPSASVTSLSPAQESKLAQDAQNYFEQYTASHPLEKLEQDAAVGQLLGGGSQPNGQQSSQILALIAEAPTAVLANPTAYVASLDAAVSPFGFGAEVSTYADGLVQGLRTVVANDLSLPVPTQTAASHNAAGPGQALPTGVIGTAAAAAAGAIGIAFM